jgi:hypothetical protein
MYFSSREHGITSSIDYNRKTKSKWRACLTEQPMEAWGTGHREPLAEEVRFARGWWCGTVGWGRGTSSPVLLAPQWRSDDANDEGVTAVASKRSLHKGNDISEGAPARQRWRWWRGPGGGSVRSSHFLDGSPTAAACEGNEILRSDSGWKAGPRFIVSSISSGSTWELLLKVVYQQQFRGRTVVDISTTVRALLPIN